MNKTVNVSNGVKELDIDINYGELYIEKGETFSLEIECTERHEIFAEEDGSRLTIWSERMKKQIHISQKHTDRIIVKMTIPEGMRFEKVRLVIGAVTLNVDALVTDCFVAKKGAGEFQIGYLEVLDFAKIDGGAGEICIEDGKIHNLKMHLGAGAVSVQAEITGNSEIDTGVGAVDLVLLGNPEDYSVTMTKGFGSCSINGFSYCNGSTYGDGPNHLKVSGGVGEVNVSFE